ncbi:MAG TPA: glycosyltransferase family 2 protein [Polyangiaceae bacterium]|nr:glycosyltransferase family 2 protein [Polyangiaceae bacterium]
MADPLVSCLMPTANRRAFVPQAIAYFQRQDYPNRELVILDDGADAVADLVPPDPRIRYERLSAKTVLGRKRNLACARARGEVLINWDDDDWFAPWRVRYQVEALSRSGAHIAGLDRVWFYEPLRGRAFRYVFPPSRRRWVCGGTCAFARAFWRENPFPEVSVGEDTRFIWANRAARIHALDDPDFYVALIHPRNTSRKHTRDARYTAVEVDAVRQLLGDDEPRTRAAISARHSPSIAQQVELTARVARKQA